MRFLADMGVSRRVIEWLRSVDHDATHLRDQGLQRMPDGDIFNKAAEEERIVLTFDLDFADIVAASRQALPSVVLFRLHNTRSDHVIVRLADVLDQSSTELTEGAIVVVEEHRHRIRRLPLED